MRLQHVIGPLLRNDAPGGVVARRVVHHDEFVRPAVERAKGAQAAAQLFGTVARADDDGGRGRVHR